jgi:hypothetical protein
MWALILCTVLAAFFIETLSRNPAFPYSETMCFPVSGKPLEKFRNTGVWRNGAPVYHNWNGRLLWKPTWNVWQVDDNPTSLPQVFPESRLLPGLEGPLVSANAQPCKK